jgi:hypothetical protein
MNKFQFAHRNATIKAHEAAIRAELARHPAVKATLSLFPPKLRDQVRLHVSDYSNTMQFTLTLDDLDTFKDKTLVKILSRFADGDWESRSVDYTYSDTPNRDFAFTRKLAWTPKPSKHTRWLAVNCGDYYVPTSFEIHVGIYAYVKSDSPLCRMVVTEVKEEVVRKEIKQIVCA